MNDKTHGPESYPGFYAIICWVFLLFYAGLGIAYGVGMHESEDFRWVARSLPSPYGLLIALGILTLIAGLFCSSVQATMNALASCLGDASSRRVERHGWLFFFGILVKIVAVLGTGFSIFNTLERYKSLGIHAEGILAVFLVAEIVIGLGIFANGALLTAQSWNGGAARLLAANTGGGAAQVPPGGEIPSSTPQLRADADFLPADDDVPPVDDGIPPSIWQTLADLRAEIDDIQRGRAQSMHGVSPEESGEIPTRAPGESFEPGEERDCRV